MLLYCLYLIVWCQFVYVNKMSDHLLAAYTVIFWLSAVRGFLQTVHKLWFLVLCPPYEKSN